MRDDVKADLERNYSPEVVMLTSGGCGKGHDAVRRFRRVLKEHVPPER